MSKPLWWSTDINGSKIISIFSVLSSGMSPAASPELGEIIKG